MTPRGNLAAKDPVPSAQGWRRVAIVGAGSLKGKEVKDAIEQRNFPALDVKLLDDEESLGQLDSVGDEATFIQSVLPENLQGADVVFLASGEAFTRRNLPVARRAASVIVDLSYALESEPGAVLSSPWVEQELRLDGSPAELTPAGPAIAVVAHPAATVLALLLSRAQKAGGLRSAVCTVFEPASEHGRRGMDELHNQTVNLLSFQQMPTDVFDVQIAFNMLSRFGEKSTAKLEGVEHRILAHLQKITGGRLLMPALAVAQAPIFHGHIFSIYLQFEQSVVEADLARALAGEHVNTISPPEGSPSNVSAAGQDDILLAVRPDATRDRGFWLWAAADNLRIAALTAVDCAATLALGREKGRPQ